MKINELASCFGCNVFTGSSCMADSYMECKGEVCPCSICILKSICKNQCDDYNDYATFRISQMGK